MAEDQGLAFVIDGREFPSPELDSLNMGERRVMYDLCGIVQEDFAPLEDEAQDEHDARVQKMTRHPGFLESLMVIAYQRGNPDMAAAKVKKTIENTSFLDAVEKWAESAQEADTPVPLALTSSPNEPSSNEEDGHNDSSGASSPNGSDEPAEDRRTIGTSPSVTSRTSGRVTLHT